MIFKSRMTLNISRCAHNWQPHHLPHKDETGRVFCGLRRPFFILLHEISKLGRVIAGPTVLSAKGRRVSNRWARVSLAVNDRLTGWGWLPWKDGPMAATLLSRCRSGWWRYHRNLDIVTYVSRVQLFCFTFFGKVPLLFMISLYHVFVMSYDSLYEYLFGPNCPTKLLF